MARRSSDLGFLAHHCSCGGGGGPEVSWLKTRDRSQDWVSPPMRAGLLWQLPSHWFAQIMQSPDWPTHISGAAIGWRNIKLPWKESRLSDSYFPYSTTCRLSWFLCFNSRNLCHILIKAQSNLAKYLLSNFDGRSRASKRSPTQERISLPGAGHVDFVYTV